MDRTPRYAPQTVFTMGGGPDTPVISWRVLPPGMHPNSPIIKTMTALECVTKFGSRWWGIEKGWINSELRVVVQGISENDEVCMAWKPCKRP